MSEYDERVRESLDQERALFDDRFARRLDAIGSTQDPDEMRQEHRIAELDLRIARVHRQLSVLLTAYEEEQGQDWIPSRLVREVLHTARRRVQPTREEAQE